MAWAGDRRADLPPTHEWMRIKRAVLKRDRYRCKACGNKGTYETLQCDHMGERTDHRLEVLQTLCIPCHQTKTGEQSHESRRANQRKASHPDRYAKHPGLI